MSSNLRAAGRFALSFVAFVTVVFVAGWAGWALVVVLGADPANYIAGAFATLFGIFVGVPIALRIARWQEHRAEATRTEERRKRLTDLLEVMTADLTAIRETLQYRTPEKIAFVPFLGSGVWDTIKSSGETELIESPTVLRCIAAAYDQIVLAAYLERQLWETVHDPFRGRGQYSPTPESLDLKITREIEDQRPRTLSAIDLALTEIASYRQRLGKPESRFSESL